MSDLKRTPSNKQPTDYPAAAEVLSNRRDFLSLVGKAALLAVPLFGATRCMGAAMPDPIEPGPDTLDAVTDSGEFPPLPGAQRPPDTLSQDVPEDAPPMPGDDAVAPVDVEDEFPPLPGEAPSLDVIEAQDVEGEFPPLAGDPVMPDMISSPDSE